MTHEDTIQKAVDTWIEMERKAKAWDELLGLVCGADKDAITFDALQHEMREIEARQQ